MKLKVIVVAVLYIVSLNTRLFKLNLIGYKKTGDKVTSLISDVVFICTLAPFVTPCKGLVKPISENFKTASLAVVYVSGPKVIITIPSVALPTAVAVVLYA